MDGPCVKIGLMGDQPQSMVKPSQGQMDVRMGCKVFIRLAQQKTATPLVI